MQFNELSTDFEKLYAKVMDNITHYVPATGGSMFSSKHASKYLVQPKVFKTDYLYYAIV